MLTEKKCLLAACLRFRQILKKIVDTKKEMGKTMRLSAFAMVEAKYAAGDFVPTVFDAVQTARPSTLFPLVTANALALRSLPHPLSSLIGAQQYVGQTAKCLASREEDSCVPLQTI